MAENAKSRIQILNTWIPEIIALEKPLQTAISNGCSVEILLLNPDSIQTKYRSHAIGYTDDNTVKNCIESNLTEIKRFFAGHHLMANFEVRLYDEIPSLTILIFDDTAIVGWFWNKKLGNHGPQLVLRNDTTVLFKEVISHFETTWSKAKKKDFSQLEQGNQKKRNYTIINF